MSLSFCRDTTGGFKHCKAVSFKIGLCSDPILWSWILGNDWRNAIPSASGRDGSYTKSSRRDTCQQSAQLWNLRWFGRVSRGVQTIETISFETTFIWDNGIWDLFIWKHIHMRLFHLRPHSFENYSFETTFTWDHNNLRPHSFEITFTLRHAKVKLLWFVVNHILMIYLPLLWERPEVLKDDYSFEVLQDDALPCPRWLTLGCKCTRTFKDCGSQKILHTSGLERSVAPLKCHFIRPSQRIICFAFLPGSVVGTGRMGSCSTPAQRFLFLDWLQWMAEELSLPLKNYLIHAWSLVRPEWSWE